MKKRECEEAPLYVLFSPSELLRASCAALHGVRAAPEKEQGVAMWAQLGVAAQLCLPRDCCSSKTLGSSDKRAGKARGCWPCSLTRLIIPFPTELGRRAQKSSSVLLLSEKRMRCCLGGLERLIIAFLTVMCLKRIEALPSKYRGWTDGKEGKEGVQKTIPVLVLFAHDTGSAQT